MPKRIFSGAQPTGNVHLGNYLGALRNWVALQHEYESFFCIVNLHAITLPQNPAQLAEKTRDLARIYLAVGIDPNVSTVFIQSHVKEHAELTWVLNCVARMSELERMTQYKDKARKQQDIAARTASAARLLLQRCSARSSRARYIRAATGFPPRLPRPSSSRRRRSRSWR